MERTWPDAYDLLDLDGGQLVASDVPIAPSIAYQGLLTATDDDPTWWYTTVDDGVGMRLVAIEPTTLRQVDTGVRLPADASVTTAADGHLLVTVHNDDQVYVLG